MAILKDTTVKGNLEVSEQIIENGQKVDDKFGATMAIDGKTIKLVSASGVVLSTITLS